jgi:hypothetical protein
MKRLPKINEKTFGTRLNSAETMLTHLKSFTEYKPLNPQDSTEALTIAIKELKIAASAEVAAAQNYTIAVDTRKKIFRTNTNSLTKTITPINAYIKAQYGKNSKQAAFITDKVNKIRGTKPSTSDQNTTTKTISSSQQSYASMTQEFADIISALGTLTPAYLPPNEDIRIPKLQLLHQEMHQASSDVITFAAELLRLKNQKDTIYQNIKTSCLRIKDAIKAQYGSTSIEYTLIKSLKF